MKICCTPHHRLFFRLHTIVFFRLHTIVCFFDFTPSSLLSTPHHLLFFPLHTIVSTFHSTLCGIYLWNLEFGKFLLSFGSVLSKTFEFQPLTFHELFESFLNFTTMNFPTKFCFILDDTLRSSQKEFPRKCGVVFCTK